MLSSGDKVGATNGSHVTKRPFKWTLLEKVWQSVQYSISCHETRSEVSESVELLAQVGHQAPHTHTLSMFTPSTNVAPRGH